VHACIGPRSQTTNTLVGVSCSKLLYAVCSVIFPSGSTCTIGVQLLPELVLDHTVIFHRPPVPLMLPPCEKSIRLLPFTYSPMVAKLVQCVMSDDAVGCTVRGAGRCISSLWKFVERCGRLWKTVNTHPYHRPFCTRSKP
jgi:hypothetical protein